MCTNILAAKVRLGGTLYHCWTGHRSCWTGTQKRTWYLEFSLPQSLPVELTFRDLRPTRHQEIWNKEYSPSVEGYSHWGIFKLDRKLSMVPERLHPWVLRELMDALQGNSWLSSKSHGWTWEVSEEWKQVPSIFKSSKKLPCFLAIIGQSASTESLIPGKATEQLIIKIASSHMNDKKANGSSKHGFIKGKSHLTNF